ncbi:hypothetical protein DHEL01_v203878 [Diaporthe helianthi]|uniref:Uncharacterized protein n=1 Tax=Diaporthe helianthi TaxID=158607 RepID=A0A2P5I5G5_DIAHE|nr:hypothetical protein DHEL01_v203878 [Diaporthe helianthi]
MRPRGPASTRPYRSAKIVEPPQQDKRRRATSPQTTTTTAMETAGNGTGNPFFQDLLRYGLHGQHSSTHTREEQGRPAVTQTPLYQQNHHVQGLANVDDTYVDNGVGGKVSQHEIKTTHQLVGEALEDRRTQARDRIRGGGWKAHIAEFAVRYTRQIAWKDRPYNMMCVSRFIRSVLHLGELLEGRSKEEDEDENEADIRGFLDGNIHKLIAFHAMDKAFQIPHCIVRRTSLKTTDGAFKYAWFRSVLRELQGLDAAFWLRPYRTNGAREATPEHGLFDSGFARVEQGVEESPWGQLDTSTSTIKPLVISQGINNHGRGLKRARGSMEELHVDLFTPGVKQEADEDGSLQGPGSSLNDSATLTEMERGDDGEGEKEVGRRTLTVLFHGMRSDVAKESEHVQVYVPRTAKGVTINFL